MPFVTRVTTSSVSGLASSRFGPTVPVVPASARVWQPPQPALVKTALPAVASPVSASAGRSAVDVVAAARADDRVAVAVVSVAAEAAGGEQPQGEREQKGDDDVSGASRWSLTRPADACVGCTDDRRSVDARALALERVRRRRRVGRHGRVRRQRRAARAAARGRRARAADADAPAADPRAPRPRRARGRALRRFGIPVVTGDFVTGGLDVGRCRCPGHSDDGVAFVVNDEVCFSGDVLFKDAVGGGPADVVPALGDGRLMALPPETARAARATPRRRRSGASGRRTRSSAYWRGVDPSLGEPVRVGGRGGELVVWSPDYDGKGKALVRFADGREAIVGGSRVERG